LGALEVKIMERVVSISARRRKVVLLDSSRSLYTIDHVSSVVQRVRVYDARIRVTTLVFVEV
jgi:hypothetical protein